MINGNNTKKRYSEKLQDARWIARRNEIVKRDGAKCSFCESNDHLNVHHRKYTGEPWEAPDEDLLTVCRLCHLIIEECKTRYKSNRAVILSIEKLDFFEDSKIPLVYRMVLLELKSGHTLVVVYEFKGRDHRIAFWGDAFELYEVIRRLKLIKPNGERPCNALVL